MSQLPNRFEKLISTSSLPVLVDFYADWCGPCKMVSPAVERLAKEYKGRILTIKVDTDKQPAISGRYSIQSIPTIMLFHQGKQLMRLQGAYPYEALRSELEKHLP
ncbi:MAG: thioredoxin [Spirochaetota bacterium]